MDLLRDHIAGDRLKALATVAFEFGYSTTTASMLVRADTVFVKVCLKEQALNILGKRTKPCMLITHNSDTPVTTDWYERKSEQVRVWYAQNCLCQGPGMVAIPIGVENPRSPGYSGDHRVVDRVLKMKLCRKYIACLNFNVNTNRKEWEPVLLMFKGMHWVMYQSYGVPFAECMQVTKQSMFVFAPAGNGHDDHRVMD